MLKNYWSDNEQFADLFNAVLFEGRQVIKPEEIDSDQSTILEHRRYAKAIKASRDKIKIRKKSTQYGVELAMLGLENQEHIHYAMPMRLMGYDYGAYKKQYDRRGRIISTKETAMDNEAAVTEEQKKTNDADIPSYIEEAYDRNTDISLEDVRVHYDSRLPDGSGELGYASGNDIYIGPGQEKHLDHELGHVIQQRPGYVDPIVRVGDGVQFNTDEALEREADLIGWTPLPEGKSDIELPSE